MAKCARCRAQQVTCEVCYRTVKEKGVSGNVPMEALAANPEPTKFLRGDGSWQYATGEGSTPGDTVSDETAFGISPDAGSSTLYSRTDHTHGSPTAPGGGTPSESVVEETTFDLVATAGELANYSRGDHTHGTPPAPTPSSVGAEPANSNIQSHVTGTGSPHTPAGIGAEPSNSNIQSHVTGTGSPHTAAGVGALASTAFSGLAKITVGATEPSTPSVNDLWVDIS